MYIVQSNKTSETRRTVASEFFLLENVGNRAEEKREGMGRGRVINASGLMGRLPHSQTNSNVRQSRPEQTRADQILSQLRIGQVMHAMPWPCWIGESEARKDLTYDDVFLLLKTTLP